MYTGVTSDTAVDGV